MDQGDARAEAEQVQRRLSEIMDRSVSGTPSGEVVDGATDAAEDGPIPVCGEPDPDT